jgi:hypothetical protein
MVCLAQPLYYGTKSLEKNDLKKRRQQKNSQEHWLVVLVLV